MAGMIAGVECARRRRIHQSESGGTDSSSLVRGEPFLGLSRKSILCLYASNHDSFHIPTFSPEKERSVLSQPYRDDIPIVEALEAKERLHGRLRKPEFRSTSSIGNPYSSSPISSINGMLQVEVHGNNSNKRKFSWTKLSRKNTKQERCAICLEDFKMVGESTLVLLPCTHRFHFVCLVPWFHSNYHCPCCRMVIPIQKCSFSPF